MTQHSNIMKSAFIALFITVLCSFTISTFAASNSKTSFFSTVEQKTDRFEKIKMAWQRNIQSVKKVISKQYKQFRKEYREMDNFSKIGWGVVMIIAGALVTIGSIFSLSGWGFVIGLGLIIWGALKFVIGVLGIIV